MIKLVSSDGVFVEVEEAVALESQVLKGMIEDCCDHDSRIPLPEVTSKILEKVIEYCKKHVDAARESIEEENLSEDDLLYRFLAGKPTIEEQLKAWDQAFLKGVDQATLFDLILAANFLNIKTLLDLTSQTVADKIKGKTHEEINETFNLPKGFIPEEELEEVRRENPWAFE